LLPSFVVLSPETVSWPWLTPPSQWTALSTLRHSPQSYSFVRYPPAGPRVVDCIVDPRRPPAGVVCQASPPFGSFVILKGPFKNRVFCGIYSSKAVYTQRILRHCLRLKIFLKTSVVSKSLCYVSLTLVPNTTISRYPESVPLLKSPWSSGPKRSAIDGLSPSVVQVLSTYTAPVFLSPAIDLRSVTRRYAGGIL